MGWTGPLDEEASDEESGAAFHHAHHTTCVASNGFVPWIPVSKPKGAGHTSISCQLSDPTPTCLRHCHPSAFCCQNARTLLILPPFPIRYGLMYLAFATFPRVFQGAYDQGVGRASLNYLSLGIGFIIGLQISGRMQDKIYTWCKEHEVDPNSLQKTWTSWKQYKAGRPNDEKLLPVTISDSPVSNDPNRYSIPRKPLPPVRRATGFDPSCGLPEYRLPLVLPFSLLIPIGLFIYGWTAEHVSVDSAVPAASPIAGHTYLRSFSKQEIHWIVPNIGSAIFSVGLIVCFNCAQAYVVDTYTTYAASATGAAAFVRTMMGFSFPLFAPGMYDTLGVGWGNSLLGFISLILGLIAPVLLWKYGGWLRSKSTYCTG